MRIHMRTHMRIHIHVCIHTHTCVRLYVYIYIKREIDIQIQIQIPTHTHTCKHKHTDTHKDPDACTYTYIRVHVYMYIYICAYISTRRWCSYKGVEHREGVEVEMERAPGRSRVLTMFDCTNCGPAQIPTYGTRSLTCMRGFGKSHGRNGKTSGLAVMLPTP